MPTPQFEEKMLREEWLKRADEDSSTIDGKLHGWSFVMMDEDANNIADWWLSKFTEYRESLVKEVESLKNKTDDKCAKCGSVLPLNWLPPICPECFYGNDKNKWDGVRTREANNQRTEGYNAAITKIIEIIRGE